VAGAKLVAKECIRGSGRDRHFIKEAGVKTVLLILLLIAHFTHQFVDASTTDQRVEHPYQVRAPINGQLEVGVGCHWRVRSLKL